MNTIATFAAFVTASSAIALNDDFDANMYTDYFHESTIAELRGQVENLITEAR
jgi:hypothetical protein